MESYWSVIQRIIRESDVVLAVLDARLVQLSRNKRVEELVREQKRPIIFVMNKSDLVSKDSLQRHVASLRGVGDVVFVSTKQPRTRALLFAAIRRTFKKYGKRARVERGKFDPKPTFKEARGDIVVGVLGYPNVGKSSLINFLARRKKARVSKKAGTTRGIHWINATDDILFLDSPGVIPLAKDDEVHYGLIGAKDEVRLKRPDLVVHAIIDLFIEQNPRAFETWSGVSLEGKTSDEIVEEVGKEKRFLLSGGRIDEHRVWQRIIRDWQSGVLRL